MIIDESSEYESEEDPESEYQAHSVDGEANNLIYGLYSQLKVHKEHFSNMQYRYRSLASTWVLAAFIGIGYLFSRHKIDLPFNISIAVVILCFLAIIGISLLWHLDIVLYQKFWVGTLFEMAKLEEKHLWLPRVNRGILRCYNDKNYRFYPSYYYMGCNNIFLIIGGVVASFLAYPSMVILISIVIFTAALIFLIPFWMNLYSEERKNIYLDQDKPEDSSGS